MFQFYFLLIAVRFSQHHLLKRLSFPSVYSCLLYHWPEVCAFVSGLSYVFHWSIFLTCSIDLNFVYNNKNRKQSICPWMSEWLNSDTSLPWNTSQQWKGRSYWFGQQLVWISEAFSKYYTLQYLFNMTKFRNNRIVVAGV